VHAIQNKAAATPLELTASRLRTPAVSRKSAGASDPCCSAPGPVGIQQLDELIAFCRARKGRAYGFRFKDWTDYKATGQLTGTGNGAIKIFQLVKRS
jgi:hypothetical protein